MWRALSVLLVTLLVALTAMACVEPRDDISQSEIAILDARTGDVLCSVSEALSCPAFDLGDAPVNAAVTATVLVVNPSAQDLSVTKVSTSGLDALRVDAIGVPTVVPPETMDDVGALRLTLHLDPEAQQTLEGSLEIQSDARNTSGPLSLPIVAHAVTTFSPCLLFPSDVDFGATAEGTSLTRELALVNLCGAPIELTSMEINGDAAGHFSFASQIVLPYELAAHETLALTAEAAPEVGAWSATLDFVAKQGSSIASSSIVLRAAGL